MTVHYVITTINAPTKQVKAVHDRVGANLLVVGDHGTPADAFARYVYLGVEEQRWMSLNIKGHYARKNLGYLWAMSRGAGWIRETDDDNDPYANFFSTPFLYVEAQRVNSKARWTNAFSYYTKEPIWPRGLPLEYAGRSAQLATSGVHNAVIQQGLSDGAPDVDAVQRLTGICDDEVTFDQGPRVAFYGAGPWTPFNSQVTTWHKSVFPLMYLPVTCRFRVTDILRSYVALALMPPSDALVYEGALAYQDRNPHDFARDFRSELPLYEADWRDVIETAAASSGSVGDRMFNVYAALARWGIVDHDELRYLYAWLRDWESTL